MGFVMTQDLMPDWFMVCAAITAFSVTGFVIIAVMWLKKLRESVGTALAETATQHIRTSQRFGEEIDEMRKRQTQYEQQIQTLAQAGLRLRQELVNVSTKIESSHVEAPRGDHTVH
jgi:hypothetical protein